MSNSGESLQLERALSWQDIRDVPYLSTRRPSIIEEGGYRYVDCTNRKYRKPPIQFSISISRIDGNTEQTTCRPGSIFEGIVYIKLSTPLAAEQLKVVFKAAEQVHGGNKKRGSKLFAIKTVLWGAVTRNSEQWPILETGEHQFPFMCEIPLVNYPPTFRHHLASCEFELLACIDRPGIRPFQTIPYSVRYEPFVLSPTTVSGYRENIELNNHTKVLVTLDDCYYNLLDSNADILKVQVSTTTQSIGSIEAYLKREVNVQHGTYCQSDSMVMSHVEQSSFGVVKNIDNEGYTYYIRLPIPSESSKNNNPSILKNFSVLGMTPTFYFSKYIKMEYKLYITVKVKYGLISSKKQICSIPIYFGTIPLSETSPENLLCYRDEQVVSDTSFRTKPRFIKPQILQEQLPAYEYELSPPEYVA